MNTTSNCDSNAGKDGVRCTIGGSHVRSRSTRGAGSLDPDDYPAAQWKRSDSTDVLRSPRLKFDFVIWLFSNRVPPGGHSDPRVQVPNERCDTLHNPPD